MGITLFEDTSSLMHRMDPLSKFAWGTLMMIWVLYIARPEVQMGMFVLMVLIAWFAARISPIRLLKPVRAFVTLGIFMIVFQALLAPGQHVLWRWGILRVTAEGLSAGLTVGMRLILIVTISMILAITTDPRRLVVALSTHARIPYRFAYTVYATLRFIPVMRHEATVINEAQTIRGARVDTSLVARARQYISLLVPLISSGIRQASTAAIAMDSRAFGLHKERTNLLTVNVPASGPIFVGISLLAFIAYIIFGPRAEIRLLY